MAGFVVQSAMLVIMHYVVLFFWLIFQVSFHITSAISRCGRLSFQKYAYALQYFLRVLIAFAKVRKPQPNTKIVVSQSHYLTNTEIYDSPTLPLL